MQSNPFLFHLLLLQLLTPVPRCLPVSPQLRGFSLLQAPLYWQILALFLHNHHRLIHCLMDHIADAVSFPRPLYDTQRRVMRGEERKEKGVVFDLFLKVGMRESHKSSLLDAVKGKMDRSWGSGAEGSSVCVCVCVCLLLKLSCFARIFVFSLFSVHISLLFFSSRKRWMGIEEARQAIFKVIGICCHC